jgi:hypothetical protein
MMTIRDSEGTTISLQVNLKFASLENEIYASATLLWTLLKDFIDMSMSLGVSVVGGVYRKLAWFRYTYVVYHYLASFSQCRNQSLQDLDAILVAPVIQDP